MKTKLISFVVFLLLLVIFGMAMFASGTYLVNPGYRGVKVTLGKVSPEPIPKGSTVLVINSRGTRSVDVSAWVDPIQPLSGNIV